MTAIVNAPVDLPTRIAANVSRGGLEARVLVRLTTPNTPRHYG
jgi:hypothetical protein